MNATTDKGGKQAAPALVNILRIQAHVRRRVTELRRALHILSEHTIRCMGSGKSQLVLRGKDLMLEKMDRPPIMSKNESTELGDISRGSKIVSVEEQTGISIKIQDGECRDVILAGIDSLCFQALIQYLLPNLIRCFTMHTITSKLR
jgi:hypothetical protein